MTRRAAVHLRAPLCAALTLLAPVPCGATQAPPAVPASEARPIAAAPAAPATQTPAPAASSAFPDVDAETTRRRMAELLRQLPLPVARAVRSDPSLLLNASYLAPYPGLAAFVLQRPEVGRNPGYFVGEMMFRERSAELASIELFEEILGGLAALTVLSLLIGLIAWLVRTVIDHRRWLRISRVQADVHTKLLDRLSSNEDMLAYIQTSPGRRFLESAPIPIDGEARGGAAPLSRVVWSVQSGVVLGTLGLGLYVAQRQVPQEVAQGIGVIGTIVLSLGIGFVLAAAVAYFVASRTGLLPVPKGALDE